MFTITRLRPTSREGTSRRGVPRPRPTPLRGLASVSVLDAVLLAVDSAGFLAEAGEVLLVAPEAVRLLATEGGLVDCSCTG